MSLTQKDLEVIERIIYKSGDDIAVSVARSFERLEERIDAAESRLYSRIDDLEEAIEAKDESVDISEDERALGVLVSEAKELLAGSDSVITKEVEDWLKRANERV